MMYFLNPLVAWVLQVVAPECLSFAKGSVGASSDQGVSGFNYEKINRYALFSIVSGAPVFFVVFSERSFRP